MMIELKRLLHLRYLVETRVTRIHKAVEEAAATGTTQPSLVHLKVLAQKLDDHFREFRELHYQIMVASEEEDFSKNEQVGMDFEIQHTETCVLVETTMKTIRANGALQTVKAALSGAHFIIEPIIEEQPRQPTAIQSVPLTKPTFQSVATEMNLTVNQPEKPSRGMDCSQPVKLKPVVTADTGTDCSKSDAAPKPPKKHPSNSGRVVDVEPSCDVEKSAEPTEYSAGDESPEAIADKPISKPCFGTSPIPTEVNPEIICEASKAKSKEIATSEDQPHPTGKLGEADPVPSRSEADYIKKPAVLIPIKMFPVPTPGEPPPEVSEGNRDACVVHSQPSACEVSRWKLKSSSFRPAGECSRTKRTCQSFVCPQQQLQQQ